MNINVIAAIMLPGHAHPRRALDRLLKDPDGMPARLKEFYDAATADDCDSLSVYKDGISVISTQDSMTAYRFATHMNINVIAAIMLPGHAHPRRALDRLLKDPDGMPARLKEFYDAATADDCDSLSVYKDGISVISTQDSMTAYDSNLDKIATQLKSDNDD